MLPIFKMLEAKLVTEIMEFAQTAEIPKDTEILREGQFVKVIPLVISGLLKVFTRFEEKELLLYYIKTDESCIMSFASGIKDQPSKIYATTEEDSKLLLLPVSKVKEWIKHYPNFNNLFFQQYNLRYTDLIETVSNVIFNKTDRRIYDYLKEKSELTGNNPLKISHRQIAAELGTAREVVSRLIKKLENEGKVKQHSNNIEIVRW